MLKGLDKLERIGIQANAEDVANVGVTSVTNAGLATLASMPALAEIQIEGDEPNRAITDDGLRALLKMKQLELLRLGKLPAASNKPRNELEWKFLGVEIFYDIPSEETPKAPPLPELPWRDEKKLEDRG